MHIKKMINTCKCIARRSKEPDLKPNQGLGVTPDCELVI